MGDRRELYGRFRRRAAWAKISAALLLDLVSLRWVSNRREPPGTLVLVGQRGRSRLLCARRSVGPTSNATAHVRLRDRGSPDRGQPPLACLSHSPRDFSHLS